MNLDYRPLSPPSASLSTTYTHPASAHESLSAISPAPPAALHPPRDRSRPPCSLPAPVLPAERTARPPPASLQSPSASLLPFSFPSAANTPAAPPPHRSILR